MKSILQKFESLDQAPRFVAQLCAFMNRDLLNSEVERLVAISGIHFDQKLASIKTELRAADILVKYRSYCIENDRLAAAICKRTIDSGELPKILETIEGFSKTSDFSYSSIRYFIKDSTHYLFYANPEKVLANIDSCKGKNRSIYPYRQIMKLLESSLQGFSKTWFSTLPRELSELIALNAVFSRVFDIMTKCDQHDFFLSFLKESEQGCAYLDLYYFLTEFKVPQKVISLEHQSVFNLCIRGSYLFLLGNHEGAFTVFEQAIKLQRKESKRSKDSLDFIFNSFYALSALSLGDKAKAYAISEKAQKDDPHRIDRNILEAIGNLTTSLGMVEYYHHRMNLNVQSPLVTLFNLFTQEKRLNLQEKDKIYFIRTHEISKKPPNHVKQDWAKWNLEKMLDSLGEKVNWEPHSQVSPLFADSKIKEEWEIRLENLLNAVQVQHTSIRDISQEQLPEKGSKRIVWTLEEHDQLFLTPKLQSFNGKSWSAGRMMSLKSLHSEDIYDDIVSAADQKITRHIIASPRLWGYHEEVEMSYPGCLFSAIDHPYLFWKQSKDHTPVKLSEEQFSLDIKHNEEKKTINLSLFPYPHYQDKMCYVKVSQNHIQLFKVTQSIRNLAEHIPASGLEIPERSKPSIEKLVKNLDSTIKIQSELAIDNKEIQKIEADWKIQVHAENTGSQFHFNIYVQPFGEDTAMFYPAQGRQSVIHEVDGKKVIAIRDLERERELFNAIQMSIPFAFEESFHWISEDLDQTLEALYAFKELEPEVQLHWKKGKPIRIGQIVDGKSFNISLQKKQQWFEFDGDVQLDEENILSWKEILRSIENRNNRFIKINDDQFVALTKDLQKSIKKLSLYSHNGQIHQTAVDAVDEVFQDMNLKQNQSWNNIKKTMLGIKLSEPVVPKNLLTDLRSYQKEGYQWLSRLSQLGFGACLADDMGLGKTIQAIALILSRYKEGPSLVIAPSSVCFNWKTELEKFAPSLEPVHLSKGADFPSIDWKKLKNEQVFIISYGLLHSQVKSLKEVSWNNLILDEAQSVKNDETKRHKSVSKIDAKFKVLTTGTPIENSLSELWSLFNIINPHLFPNKKDFEKRFVDPIVSLDCEETRKALKNMIRPYILRRLKSEVAKELPDKTEIPIYVDFDKSEREFYEALRLKSLEDLMSLESDQGKHMQTLAALTKLRLAACHPRLVDKKINLPSSKHQELQKVMSNLLVNNHKALIFSQFVKHLDLVKEYLLEKNIPFCYLDGSTPQSKRAKIIQDFKEGDIPFFLISLKAGGFGLNLTEANYVIHLDPWWNPAVEDQATDRAHRIGQKNPVTVYRMISKNTIEEKIIQLHDSKRDLADSLLDGTGMAGKMSTKEMIELIQGV